jgi:predicted DNA binding CopG/RHH family protein
MKPQKIHDLKRAAERAYQNYLETKSPISYRMWQRLLQEIKKEEGK